MTRRKRLMKKWPLYACIGIIGIGLCFFFYIQFTPRAPLAVAEQKKNIIYPTQYSDTHITENAKATDQRFKYLATYKKESFLASVISSFQTSANTAIATTNEPEKGTWLWTPTLDLTPAYWNPIIADAKKNGIHNIYLSIDSYLDIYVMPGGPEKEAKKKAFDGILENFIAAAHKNNMTVDAEAGWRNWAEPWNEYKAFAIVDYVREFNATHSEKFRGLQYDIEPYLLDSYEMNKVTVLRNLVDLINETVMRLDKSDIALSVVIPDFYDSTSEETSQFFYGWRYDYAFDHLLRVLERRPGSQLIVMAYRNRSDGADGSIAISKDEIKTADDYHTKVIVAQETGKVLYSYTSFYNTSRPYFDAQIRNIQEAFDADPSYNGIAIHYINALLELEQN